jgi:phosphatidylinositol alpha-1,6-mannosyltransferase
VRILFVSHSFPPSKAPEENIGGMQRVALDLHRALTQSPEVKLFTFALHSTWKQTHLRTPFFMASLLLRIPFLVKAHNIEVVLFSSIVTAGLVIALSRILKYFGASTFTIVHGRDVTLPSPILQKWVLPKVFAKINGVLPISNATAEACIERNLDPKKIAVVPNGFDFNRFTSDLSKEQARTKLVQLLQIPLPPPTSFILCSVGRHVERKGFHWFVDEVMPLLPDHIEYWLAGEGDMTPRILQAIEKHGLESRVRLLGRISEEALHCLYRGGDMFVMPNIPIEGDMEGFGVVLLEAGICGMPSVAAELEGIQDVIQDGQNGRFAETGNADQFRNIILEYDADRAKLDALSKKTVLHVSNSFSWQSIVKKYLSIFKSYINP